MNLSNLPNLSPGMTLVAALGTNIALDVVGLERATPPVWGGAGIYTILKGHPWWGGAFLALGVVGAAATVAVDRLPKEPQPAQVTSGPTLAKLQDALHHAILPRSATWRGGLR